MAAVFKYADQSEPQLMWTGLGTITCIAVGDIRNTGKNVITIVNAEGQLHIYDIATASQTDGRRESMTVVSSLCIPVPVNICRILIADIDGDGQNEFVAARTDRYLHAFDFTYRRDEQQQQQWMPRSRADTINSTSSRQGLLEASALDVPKSTHMLATATTTPVESSALSQMLNTERAPARERSQERRLRTATYTATALKDVLATQQSAQTEKSEGAGGSTPELLGADEPPAERKAWLSERQSWMFDSQLGTLSISVDDDGHPLLFVAMAGGTFATINHLGEKSVRTSPGAKSAEESEATVTAAAAQENYFLKSLNQAMSFVPARYVTGSGDDTVGSSSDVPMSVIKRQQAEVGCDVLTGIRRHAQAASSTAIAVVTSDGTIAICDAHGLTSKYTDLRVTHQLFCAAAVPLLHPDVCSDEANQRRASEVSTSTEALPEPPCTEDVIVACGWDGTTYIVDTELNAVQVLGGERVCAFLAGLYTVSPGKTCPCFFYVNFEDEISISTEVYFRSIPVQTLVEVATGEQHVNPVHYSPYLPPLMPHFDHTNDFYAQFDGVLHHELGKDWEDWKETREKEAMLTRFSGSSASWVSSAAPAGLVSLFRRALYDPNWLQGYQQEAARLQESIDSLERQLASGG
ncbi:hypothetical protein RI367_004752 [Sorochytrium milnesiophthora]